MHRQIHKQAEVDMIHGPLAKKIFMFALPLAVSSMLQQLFNAADIAVVGRLTNAQAMAAVGSNSSVIGLMVNLFTGLAVGANVVVGNLLGANHRSEISRAVHTIMTVALFSGFFLLLLGNLIAKPILTLMGAPDDVISLAVLYLRIYFCGMPAMMAYNFGSAVLRSRGDSRRPFGALTFAGVLNVLLNLLFVIGLKMSVAGVALATVISNYISGGLILYFLTHEEDEFRLDFRKLTIRREYLRKMMYIGVPAGLQGMVFSLSNVVIQSAVNSFGADCIAGMTAAQNFDFISYCLMNGFAQAALTFTSQNYGARDCERCKTVWRLSMAMGLGLDVLLLAVFMLSRHQLIRIFTTDENVIRYAMYRFEYEVSLHFLCGSYEITAGALRGLNRSMIPALISVFGTCLVRLVYVFFIFPRVGTPQFLIMVYPVTWIITSILMNTMYFRVRERAFTQLGSA